jgi:hypothetical protein
MLRRAGRRDNEDVLQNQIELGMPWEWIYQIKQ